MVTKTVRCDCGFIVRSDNDDKLVAELQKHALDDHKMNLTRDQVLALAQPEPDAQTPNGKTRRGAKRRTGWPTHEETEMITQDALLFDAARNKETTRLQWDAAAEAWDRWAPLLQQKLGHATEQMLDMAGAQAESHVLDVAAGAGDQTLSATRRVGPQGRALATDISAAILERAAAQARRAGHQQVQVQVLDGESLNVPPATFDAVNSRLGLIYFPDQQHALAGMHKALKPGGRVAAIVYSTPDRNSFFSIPVSVIRTRASLGAPLPGQPGPFSLGGPGVLHAAFEKAGFANVSTRILQAPVRTGSARECVRFEQESFGALHQMLATLTDDAKWRPGRRSQDCSGSSSAPAVSKDRASSSSELAPDQSGKSRRVRRAASMMRGRSKPVQVVVDGLPAHKKANVREHIESTKGRGVHS